MRVAVIGYSIEGKISAKYWHELGHEVTVLCRSDKRYDPNTPYAWRCGGDYLADIADFDIIVRTAGMHPRLLLEASPDKPIADKITTSVQEFMRVVPTRNIIGVTGTKGKGTTSTLIYHILKQAGLPVHIGGNIGIAALELLEKIQPDDYVVLELSSFQLEDFKGPSPRVATCLMVVPEHLNWHADLAEYLHAKSNLFAYQQPQDVTVYFADNPHTQEIVARSPARKVPYFAAPGAVVQGDTIVIDSQKICHVSELQLVGSHNWQNVCAAITTAWQITQDTEAIRRAVTSFEGLPHRLEKVREYRTITYYDDSFATTPETTIAAIKSFSAPISLIVGGSDKGASFEEMAREIANSTVAHLTCIGDMGGHIYELVKKYSTHITATVYKPNKGTMTEFVADATEHAAPHGVVLLSTGCASFGLFEDYKDRAAKFTAAVQALA